MGSDSQVVTGFSAGNTDYAGYVTIEGRDQGAGGACNEYEVRGDLFGVRTLLFQSRPVDRYGPAGWTIEMLLAICEHRLAGFQSGEFPCPENDLAREHIRCALKALHDRTNARIAQNLEGKMANHESGECCGNPRGCQKTAAEPEPRVTIHENVLSIRDDDAQGHSGGVVTFKVIEELQSSWSVWQTVEQTLKRLKAPLTETEWAIFERIATTQSARNGLAEVRSALARTSAA
jgi:hypothetical protein